MTSFRLSEIAASIGATVEGSGDPVITGAAGIREANAGEITFLANPRYRAYVSATRASALIVGPDHPRNGGAPPFLLRTGDPYLGFLRTLRLFGSDRPARAAGIHPTAVIEPGATLGADISIGANVVVEAGAVIGDRATLMPGTFVGPNASIGDDCFIYPNVTIRERCRLGRRVVVHPGAVIGSDGFGYVRDGDALCKVPQLGNVVLEDDVEIGANVTIDRATTGTTLVGAGTRIDNLVQVAHNVTIGPNSIICAQVGISGSTEIGRGVTLGGQAGIIGHIRLGNGATVGAQAGVTKSVAEGARISGYPAMEHEQSLRILAHTHRLPALVRAVRELEAQLGELRREIDSARVDSARVDGGRAEKTRERPR